jgi:tetratricopeptide (TPR) repeat protein
MLVLTSDGCATMRRESKTESVEKQRIVEQAERALTRGDVDRADYLLTTASKNSPYDADLHWHLAQVKEQKQDYDAALSEFRSCTLLDPQDCRGYRQLSKLLYDQGKGQLAASFAEQALAQNSADLDSLVILARVARDNKQSEKAKGYYQRALSSLSVTPELQLEIAEYNLSLNQHEQAGPILRNILRQPGVTSVILADTYWKLGLMYQATGRWEDSSESFDLALLLNPNRTSQELTLVAQVHVMSGQELKAQELIHRVLLNDPDNMIAQKLLRKENTSESPLLSASFREMNEPLLHGPAPLTPLNPELNPEFAPDTQTASGLMETNRF